jgi:hypothetical protein
LARGRFLRTEIEKVVRLVRNNGVRRWFFGRDRAFEEQITAYLGTYYLPEETITHVAALYLGERPPYRVVSLPRRGRRTVGNLAPARRRMMG